MCMPYWRLFVVSQVNIEQGKKPTGNYQYDDHVSAGARTQIKAHLHWICWCASDWFALIIGQLITFNYDSVRRKGRQKKQSESALEGFCCSLISYSCYSVNSGTGDKDEDHHIGQSHSENTFSNTSQGCSVSTAATASDTTLALDFNITKLEAEKSHQRQTTASTISSQWDSS